jgi:chromosome partitioning protein
MEFRMAKAQVVSLIQMKGGVGKTTCAVNLAAYLAKEHNKKVLLVDFDPQTNASFSLLSEERWREWEGEHGTMADVLEAEHKRKGAETLKLADCIISDVVPEIPGLDLIPSHLKLTFLDMDLAARPGRERIFARKLEKVLPQYDFVLCDCPPNLMTATQNALYASDWYLVPMQPDFLSSIGLSMLQDRLGYLRKNLEFRLRCLGVVYSRVRRHIQFHQETMDRLKSDKAFKKLYFFETFIPENITLGEAPMQAKPISLYDPAASGAEAFSRLAKEFLARLK